MDAWALGEDIYFDEKTQDLQQSHINKQRITYKTEGVSQGRASVVSLVCASGGSKNQVRTDCCQGHS
eukprot:3389264-Ditylum_brightwellii.AAC.1